MKNLVIALMLGFFGVALNVYGNEAPKEGAPAAVEAAPTTPAPEVKETKKAGGKKHKKGHKKATEEKKEETK